MLDLQTIRTSISQYREALETWYRRRNRLGAKGERAAVRFLHWKKRLHIAEASARNIYGEIDIIAIDKKSRTIVFVEVKTRQSHDRGHPAEAVTAEKQKRITRIALAFLKHNSLLDTCSVRFDVVAVTWPKDQRRPTIQHYENAFDAVGDYQMFS